MTTTVFEVPLAVGIDNARVTIPALAAAVSKTSEHPDNLLGTNMAFEGAGDGADCVTGVMAGPGGDSTLLSPELCESSSIVMYR